MSDNWKVEPITPESLRESMLELTNNIVNQKWTEPIVLTPRQIKLYTELGLIRKVRYVKRS